MHLRSSSAKPTAEIVREATGAAREQQAGKREREQKTKVGEAEKIIEHCHHLNRPIERSIPSKDFQKDNWKNYLRVNLSPSIHFSTRTQVGIGPGEFDDNRSFRRVSTATATSLPSPPRPSSHQIVNDPDDLPPGCVVNLLLTSFLASGSGRLSDFLLGDLTFPKGKSGRVVVQVARPGYNFDDEDGKKDKHLASQVQERLLREGRMYQHDLMPLQGKKVPKFYGLWVGHRPKFDFWTNRYTKEKVVVLITEYLPFSYQDMISKLPIQISCPTDLPPCPASFPEALWSELPAGLRECYLAMQEVGIAHNKYDPKHWRGDVQGRWRLIDFSEAYPEDRVRGGKPAKLKKQVTIAEA